jgi:hypothetical protein
MNERIKELMGKTLDDKFSHTWDTMTHEGLLQFSEKFAELIVRECIDKITTYDLVPGHSAKWEDIYDIHTRLLQDLGEELKEHFGVTK